MIGERIRALRLACGLSQSELGGSIGVTVAEVELFETGARHVGAARLIGFAKRLGVDVGMLFQDTDETRDFRAHGSSSAIH
jgi:transcriptional regulator with XRE-family HTH domain